MTQNSPVHSSIHGPSASFLDSKQETQNADPPTFHQSGSPGKPKQVGSGVSLLGRVHMGCLLLLPLLYYTRMKHMVAEYIEPKLRAMILDESAALKSNRWKHFDLCQDSELPPHVEHFKRSWGEFIKSLVKEWSTLNVVSALFITAILTLLQLESVGEDPVTRTIAFFSLACALASLLYNCVYIVYFSAMMKPSRGLTWIEEVLHQPVNKNPSWNKWVFLALPAASLCWSIITFVTCIFLVIWRVGFDNPAELTPLSPHSALGPRIVLSVLSIPWFLYLFMILKTFGIFKMKMDEEDLLKDRKEEHNNRRSEKDQKRDIEKGIHREGIME